MRPWGRVQTRNCWRNRRGGWRMRDRVRYHRHREPARECPGPSRRNGFARRRPIRKPRRVHRGGHHVAPVGVFPNEATIRDASESTANRRHRLESRRYASGADRHVPIETRPAAPPMETDVEPIYGGDPGRAGGRSMASIANTPDGRRRSTYSRRNAAAVAPRADISPERDRDPTIERSECCDPCRVREDRGHGRDRGAASGAATWRDCTGPYSRQRAPARSPTPTESCR